MSYQQYADIIIDISHENLDKTYQYAIPDEYLDKAVIGSLVEVPFGRGNRSINGYIVGTSEEPKLEEKLIKPLTRVIENAPVIESHLIYLAYWMKETFGGTMNDALKTVIPVKKAVRRKEHKSIRLLADAAEANRLLEEYRRRNNTARVRLLEALLKQHSISYEEADGKLKISRSVIQGLEKLCVIETVIVEVDRNPIRAQVLRSDKVELNEEQQLIADAIKSEYCQGIRTTYLIHGVTGSGKTEVYMDIIASVIAKQKQVIVLIPEIALTYQTVMRFYGRFGNRVTILNSRMSQGERYDQSLRAKKGEVDIIIGPRSALFTPFQNLGLIIIDEEHETSYKSETTPKYHTIPVAVKRAELVHASVILGSATPSLESYEKAIKGEYKLYKLTRRAKEAVTPRVWIVDLREELKNRNKSIFSIKLRELIEDRLSKREQIMLFLNRRGYAGFISCRSCGHVMKCPHCDISLTFHYGGRMVCHYCGYEEAVPGMCPSCKSKYIAAFGTGTQKVEELVRKEFPQARVLRMDTDTTRNKGDHERILKAFAERRADILVGTQMIVKGHDFPKVTLVGIIAADLSLYAGDFRAGERTFQLLCQAAGRAGRDALPGEVVIQTYHPEHYSIITAAEGNYESFYEQEMLYRRMMQYPPAAHILLALITSKEEDRAVESASCIGEAVKELTHKQQMELQVIGPAPAGISKVNDIYRQVIYLKHTDYSILVDIKNYLEGFFSYSERFSGCSLQFDFDPMGSY